MLFRKEVLAAKSARDIGPVVVISPIPLQVVAITAFIVFITIILFAYFASYTKKATLPGFIFPKDGIIKVYAPQPSRVIKLLTHEGAQVNKGDLLYILNRESSSQLGQTDILVRTELENQHSRMADNHINLTNQLLAIENNLKNQIEESDKTRSILNKKIIIQKKKIALLLEKQTRFKEMHKSGYVSNQELDDNQLVVLSEQTNLDTLYLEEKSLDKQRLDAISYKNEQTASYKDRINQLENTISEVKNQLVRNESNENSYIYAPISGTATSILSQVGQYVDASKPLLVVIPEHEPLVAFLYATSKSVGFIKQNDSVRIRYKSFPYEKFGQYTGTVTHISKTAMSLNDAVDFNIPASNASEGLYKVTISLDKQYVNTYGKKTALVSGMEIDADVYLETRRLYEWVLDPLYSITGRI
ncbi:putative microcin H47 secretion ATP-binding protein mchF [Yersinia intermedia]|uniref:Putative microcin H47 secretion ATP-binding protein mchF n=1 Tax=Yersinia intermedia TaxID=631 RepID=A0A0H5MHJ8_YERIN|nr:HlyD family efflux transporter periplasmic adaptor subunit [Yersinia intermedia]CRY56526.1 putative microcin H47 secretion ATP-binding protein mchF [Yersinia intermedia]